ncbi:ATPase [Streptomyces poonensis]|uniref:ATPase n=1 Tax=Streptomyces poonensis TaxID=68255 RepID=A0A918Q9P4_9ACTN|nr:ATPase [Streptomyces poonensis]GLJ89657.1 ATPase [Streptomyces poonensis]
MELQALPTRIGQVRRIVSAQLRYWHLDSLIDQAALGVTELLTNVHRHAEPDKSCTVEIELLLDRLTVSVHDNDPRLPELRDADITETCGRGLAMVAAVSESWGARPHGASGKVVWFTLPAPSEESVESVAAPKRPSHGAVHTATHRPAPRRRRAEHTPARSAVAG